MSTACALAATVHPGQVVLAWIQIWVNSARTALSSFPGTVVLWSQGANWASTITTGCSNALRCRTDFEAFPTELPPAPLKPANDGNVSR